MNLTSMNNYGVVSRELRGEGAIRRQSPAHETGVIVRVLLTLHLIMRDRQLQIRSRNIADVTSSSQAWAFLQILVFPRYVAPSGDKKYHYLVTFRSVFLLQTYQVHSFDLYGVGDDAFDDKISISLVRILGLQGYVVGREVWQRSGTTSRHYRNVQGMS